jgi:hypothetical protein
MASLRALQPHRKYVGPVIRRFTRSFLRVLAASCAGPIRPDACLLQKTGFLPPWYANRPDDKAFLEQDKKTEHPFAARQADEQGPHETTIRAGEERVLAWIPGVRAPGSYTVRARLIYDLNSYNDREFEGDQFEIAQQSLDLTIPTSQ